MTSGQRVRKKRVTKAELTTQLEKLVNAIKAFMIEQVTGEIEIATALYLGAVCAETDDMIERTSAGTSNKKSKGRR